METYDSITEAITALRLKGYTTDFNLKEHALHCNTTQVMLYHYEFVLDNILRFDGMSDPADETILYAISGNSKKMKGLLINGYGIYSDPVTDEMAAKLN